MLSPVPRGRSPFILVSFPHPHPRRSGYEAAPIIPNSSLALHYRIESLLPNAHTPPYLMRALFPQGQSYAPSVISTAAGGVRDLVRGISARPVSGPHPCPAVSPACRLTLSLPVITLTRSCTIPRAVIDLFHRRCLAIYPSLFVPSYLRTLSRSRSERSAGRPE